MSHFLTKQEAILQPGMSHQEQQVTLEPHTPDEKLALYEQGRLSPAEYIVCAFKTYKPHAASPTNGADLAVGGELVLPKGLAEVMELNILGVTKNDEFPERVNDALKEWATAGDYPVLNWVVAYILQLCLVRIMACTKDTENRKQYAALLIDRMNAAYTRSVTVCTRKVILEHMQHLP